MKDLRGDIRADALKRAASFMQIGGCAAAGALRRGKAIMLIHFVAPAAPAAGALTTA